jgi:hypothetical protein
MVKARLPRAHQRVNAAPISTWRRLMLGLKDAIRFRDPRLGGVVPALDGGGEARFVGPLETRGLPSARSDRSAY